MAIISKQIGNRKHSPAVQLLDKKESHKKKKLQLSVSWVVLYLPLGKYLFTFLALQSQVQKTLNSETFSFTSVKQHMQGAAYKWEQHSCKLAVRISLFVKHILNILFEFAQSYPAYCTARQSGRMHDEFLQK